jgi:hypothetical protein
VLQAMKTNECFFPRNDSFKTPVGWRGLGPEHDVENISQAAAYLSSELSNWQAWNAMQGSTIVDTDASISGLEVAIRNVYRLLNERQIFDRDPLPVAPFTDFTSVEAFASNLLAWLNQRAPSQSVKECALDDEPIPQQAANATASPSGPVSVLEVQSRFHELAPNGLKMMNYLLHNRYDNGAPRRFTAEQFKLDLPEIKEPVKCLSAIKKTACADGFWSFIIFMPGPRGQGKGYGLQNVVD